MVIRSHCCQVRKSEILKTGLKFCISAGHTLTFERRFNGELGDGTVLPCSLFCVS